MRRRIVMLVLYWLITACEDGRLGLEGELSLGVGPQGQLVFSRGDVALLSTAYGFLRTVEFSEKVTMQFGQFRFERGEERESQLQFYTGRREGDGLVLTYKDSESQVDITARAEAGGLVLGFKISGPAAALRLNFDCHQDDHFLGLGEQYAGVDGRGRRLPIWTMENGLGRAPEPALPWQGPLWASYFPMAYFVNPRGYGLVLDASGYVEFDLCAERPGVWSAEVWRTKEFSLFLTGGNPARQVEILTAKNGRAQLPPRWAFDLWLSAQGGQEEVKAYIDRAVAREFPAGILWVQDWIGKVLLPAGIYELPYHWNVDESLYPHLADLIAYAHQQGFRFLGYFNSFVRPDLEHFEEGQARGYLVLDGTGQPYTFLHSTFESALLDVFNPQALAWVQSFMEKAVALGMDGWMVDYGEWLPYDAVVHGGRWGDVAHNLYPGEWKRANLELMQRLRPAGDFVLFSRAGHTGSASLTQVHWAGDQEASFDPYDGLQTVVPAGISLSLCGVPFFGHDIAGFSGGPSSKELFWCWTELGAFSPIMRTHDGQKKYENWNYEKDAETTRMFVLYARLHHELGDYLWRLAEEFENNGLPLIRHLALEFPDDPEAVAQDYEYLLGPDFLVAPVLEEGARLRRLYLPEGSWLHIWDEKEYQGGRYLEVEALLHLIPVFYRGKAEDLFLPRELLEEIKSLGGG